MEHLRGIILQNKVRTIWLVKVWQVIFYQKTARGRAPNVGYRNEGTEKQLHGKKRRRKPKKEWKLERRKKERRRYWDSEDARP